MHEPGALIYIIIRFIQELQTKLDVWDPFPFKINEDSRLSLELRGVPNSFTIGFNTMIMSIIQRIVLIILKLH